MQISNGIGNKEVEALAYSGNNIFAGILSSTPSGVYISTNNGTTWTQTSLNNQNIYSLAVIGSDLFAGTRDYGVYLSSNNGTNWIRNTLNQQVTSFSFIGNNIFAGTCCNGVYFSTNYGTSWTQRNEGLGINTNINDVCILNNYIFAGIGAKGMGGAFRRPLSELTNIQSISNEIPIQFSLSQNYPNPFNPMTKIKFAIPYSSFVTVVNYDALGREIETIVNEQLQPGTYEVDWDASIFSSGIYFCKLATGDFDKTNKMVLIR